MDSYPSPLASPTPQPQQPADQHRPPSAHGNFNEKGFSLSRPQSIHTNPYSKSSRHCGRDSVLSHPFSPSPTTSTTDHRLPSHPDRHSIPYPPPAWIDEEKHACGVSHGFHASQPGVEAVVYDQGQYHEKGPEEKAWQLLLFLSGPCALLSGAIALWTMTALLLSLVLAPLRLCSSRPLLSEQLQRFLAPALNLQLHLIYSHNPASGYSTPMLILVHLFSPLVAFGVAIAAWTAAGFWFFSSILGDPGGHDGHNDGKESILGVRGWWERWLSRALRVSSARLGECA